MLFSEDFSSTFGISAFQSPPEVAQNDAPAASCWRQRIYSKTERPRSSQAIASPSTTHNSAGKASTAATISGKRSLKMVAIARDK